MVREKTKIIRFKFADKQNVHNGFTLLFIAYLNNNNYY